MAIYLYIAAAALVAIAIGGMSIRQKIHVAGIPLNQPVYVLGEVKRDTQRNLAIVESEEKLLISAKTEEELLRAYGRQRLYLFIGAGIAIAAAIGLAIYATTVGS